MTDASEQRLAEALRARATGAGRPGGALPARNRSRAAPTLLDRIPVDRATLQALVIALLAGAVLGAGLALLSLLVPGI